jgi:penicillin-binding protein-related factor A (putative recombinase)
MKNTGKSYEKEFEEHLLRTRGKAFALHRFTDASDVKGRKGIATLQPKQPADFVSVIDGVTSYTEVKSTVSKTSFSFSLLNDHQMAQAKRVTAAGGNYTIFVFSIETNNWYRIPFSIQESYRAIKWTEMSPWI